MKRIQLFEFEDQSWFGETFRAGMTNLLNLLHKMTGLADVISIKLKDELKNSGLRSIVDLGSGSGGPMPDVLKKIQEEPELNEIELTLTDLNPSRSIVDTVNRSGVPGLHYQAEPVDATSLSHSPEGIKTMLNSFHHMPPDKAKSILRNAYEKKETILIYELSENKVPVFVWALFLPIGLSVLAIMTLFMTPFVKPLKFSQLFFTYIIPIIPLAYAWDGQASLPRIYTPDDLREMTKDIQDDHYTWRIEKALKANGKQLGYFLIGSKV